MSGKPKLTIAQIIQMAQERHLGKYNYDHVIQYDNQRTKLPIVCPEHGLFWVSCANHLHNLVGCKACGDSRHGLYHKKTTVTFIEEAVRIHGDKYSYAQVEYKNVHTKVTIICPIHGNFLQTPASHVKSRCGCPTCKAERALGGYGEVRFINRPELKLTPATLYLVKLSHESEQFVKVGITRKNVVQRFSGIHYRVQELYTIDGTSYDLFHLEQSTKKLFAHYKYRPNVKFPGHTECFVESGAEEIQKYIAGAK